ncbi:MAG: DNA N-6-adenine-methyltransferase, partial [Chloroflexi bacterium]|nr:DNA N-6-adenine-methyltransferase [Chloroflexota bacterium]
LTQDWSGKVWLNPPYARRVMDKWIDKLIYEYALGDISSWCVLVNNATDTRWAQDLLHEASAICLLKGRIRFETPDRQDKRGPLQGQMIAYQGERTDRFVRTFRLAGVTYQR